MPARILEQSTDELAEWMTLHGFPTFHARQAVRWILHGRANSFEQMTDLPRALREQLEREFVLFTSTVASHQVDNDGTQKLLLSLSGGGRIECVLMAEDQRRTICLSTQVGCGMGCVFCASGLKGVERNLTRGEILEQILRLQQLLPAEERLSHIVVMGMGESLANLENLIAALDVICSPTGLGISQRRVTISTVGLPEKIRKLAALDRQYNLAVSLHAATAELRDQLVPVNERIGLTEVMAAADHYFAVTGRQITYEYVLLGGVNDRPSDAQALGDLLAGRKAHVNVIPYNPVPGLPFERPSEAAVSSFLARVRGRGVSITIRKTKGQSIDAACGQLRRRADERSMSLVPESSVGV